MDAIAWSRPPSKHSCMKPSLISGRFFVVKEATGMRSLDGEVRVEFARFWGSLVFGATTESYLLCRTIRPVESEFPCAHSGKST
jgi:hypothetical protein